MPRILCSAVLSTLAFCMGCQDSAPQAGPARASGLPVSLLFAPDGSEYASPSDELRSRLRGLEEDERLALVEELLGLLSDKGGYSRLVVAQTLWDRPDYWSQSTRGARVIGETLIRIAEPVRHRHVPDYWLTRGPRQARALYFLIQPHCVLTVDGRDVVLYEGLPDEWSAEKGLVALDGEVVARREEYPRETYGTQPFEHVTLSSHMDEGSLYGPHTVVSQVTLVAPDGTRIRLEREVKIEVFKISPLQIVN